MNYFSPQVVAAANATARGLAPCLTRADAATDTALPIATARGQSAVRLVVRLAGFLAVVAGAFADWGLRIALPGRHGDLGLRAQWLSRWSRRLLRVLAVRVAGLGLPPQCGLLVSNHLGYLDVLVLAAVQPCVFVAKAEVRHWPVLGVLARLAGTRFVRRWIWTRNSMTEKRKKQKERPAK